MGRVPGEDGVDDVAVVHRRGRRVPVPLGVEPDAADDDRVGSGRRDEHGFVGADLADPGECPGVVEPDAERLLDVDGADETAHAPHDRGGVRPDRHELGDLDDAGARGPHGRQHQRVPVVVADGRRVRVGGTQGPVAVGLVAEQRREDRRAVEPRQAGPVDRAVPSDQDRRVGVADERVVLDAVRRGLPAGAHEPIEPPSRVRRRGAEGPLSPRR
uniref:Uncharacterized protein n=1 Tax=Neobacillus citreus TaxID=2833578 RepID=A0A942T1T1_9BACI